MKKVGDNMGGKSHRKKHRESKEDHHDICSTTCIAVPKVYDWIIHSNHENKKAGIPEDCYKKIKPYLNKCKKVTVSCTEIPKKRCCEILDVKPASTGDPQAKLITLSQQFFFYVTFYQDSKPIPDCCFTVPISFINHIILCYPEGTDIHCEVTDLTCHAVVNAALEDTVMLDVFICQEITVEAEVKLEVDATFCSPRKEIPMEDVFCKPSSIPEPCPGIYPPDQEDCKGCVSLYRRKRKVYVKDEPVYGELTVDYENQHLEVDFYSTSCRYGKQSFSFSATTCHTPDCHDDCEKLTVSGKGHLHIGKHHKETAWFKLTLYNKSNSFSLIIEDADHHCELIFIKKVRAKVDVSCSC